MTQPNEDLQAYDNDLSDAVSEYIAREVACHQSTAGPDHKRILRDVAELFAVDETDLRDAVFAATIMEPN